MSTSRALSSITLAHSSSSSLLTRRTFATSHFSSTLRPAPPSLSSLEHSANSHPHDPSHQAAFLRALAAVDPLSLVRRVESGHYATNSEVMLEYEKAKRRVDPSAHSPPFSPSAPHPTASYGHAYYAPHSASTQPSFPPPSYPSQSYPAYGQPSQPSYLGTTSHPIAVSIVKEAAEPPPRRSIFARFLSVVGHVLPVVLLGAVLYMAIPAASNGTGLMSRGQIKEFKHDGDVPKVHFSDVKGCDEAKAELEEIVAYLRNPSHFEKLGGKMVKGILLTGPPGTGKTLLAKAIAGEAQVPFFSCSGSDFEEMFVGVGARRIRDLFAAARKKAPCIIFIDEIDAVGSKRSGRDVQAARLSLNQLLVEMDGFDKTNGVIVIGATNLPGLLDPALTRPGRFDRHVVVPIPDVKGRRAILDLYAKKIPLSTDVDLDVLARGTSGCTGAQLFNLINSAALRASSKGHLSVSMRELEYAKDKILMGAERANLMSAEEKKLTAYHEGGHALVALYTKHTIPLYKATILPRGNSLGTTHFLPETDMHSQSKAQLIARMDVALGGRVAEELIFGDEMVTTGASSDLEGATKIARAMVMQYGMSGGKGLMVVDEEAGAVLSSEKKQAMDDEIDAMMRQSYDRAKQILTTHIQHLHLLAGALLKHETLDAKEIRDVLSAQGLVSEEERERLVREEEVKLKEAKGRGRLIEEIEGKGSATGEGSLSGGGGSGGGVKTGTEVPVLGVPSLT